METRRREHTNLQIHAVVKREILVRNVYERDHYRLEPAQSFLVVAVLGEPATSRMKGRGGELGSDVVCRHGLHGSYETQSHAHARSYGIHTHTRMQGRMFPGIHTHTNNGTGYANRVVARRAALTLASRRLARAGAGGSARRGSRSR